MTNKFKLITVAVLYVQLFKKYHVDLPDSGSLFWNLLVPASIWFGTTDTEHSVHTYDLLLLPDHYSEFPVHTCSHLCCPMRGRGVLNVRFSSWLVCQGPASCPRLWPCHHRCHSTVVTFLSREPCFLTPNMSDGVTACCRSAGYMLRFSIQWPLAWISVTLLLQLRSSDCSWKLMQRAVFGLRPSVHVSVSSCNVGSICSTTNKFWHKQSQWCIQLLCFYQHWMCNGLSWRCHLKYLRRQWSAAYQLHTWCLWQLCSDMVKIKLTLTESRSNKCIARKVFACVLIFICTIKK